MNMMKTFAREPLPKRLETESGSLSGNLRQAKKSVQQVAVSADKLHQAVHQLEETLKKVETTAKPLRRSRFRKAHQ
jgi:ABC-type transporter Mla subunit MlaD